MAGMTQEQLTSHIKDVVAPLIKECVGKDVADLVRENVQAALKEAAPPKPGYAQHILAAEGDPIHPAETGIKITPQAAEKGVLFTRFVRALAGARNDRERAVKIARSWGFHDVAEKLHEANEKAMAAGDPTAGGFLVPTEFSADIIELLRASGVLRSLTPTTIPMAGVSTLKIPRITAGSTATYIGENTNITKSELETGQLTLSFKKLAALVPISNDLIRYGSPNADMVVRDDMVRSLAAREDLAFIRGDGLSGTPKGLKHWISGTNKFDANATVNLANVTTDLGKAVRLLMDANINLTMQQGGTGAIDVRPGWIFAPRTWQYLFTVQNSLGVHAFRDELLRGTFWGWPFRVTTQIPITMSSSTSDTGGSNSEIYFGAYAHAVIGESMNLIVDASQEAAYHDGSNVIASFSQDQTVIRVIEEHDFALRHDRAFTLIEAVQYGS